MTRITRRAALAGAAVLPLAAAPAAWRVVELDRCATDMMTAVGDSLAWLAARGLAQPGGTSAH